MMVRKMRLLMAPRAWPAIIQTRWTHVSAFGAISANRTSTAPSTIAQGRTACPRSHGNSPMTAKMPPTIRPKLRSCFGVAGGGGVVNSLIQLKFLPPVTVAFERLLVGLLEDTVFENQQVHFGA